MVDTDWLFTPRAFKVWQLSRPTASLLLPEPGSPVLGGGWDVGAVAAFGAVLLACTMVGAIVAHYTVLHVPATGPIVLLALTAVIAWLLIPVEGQDASIVEGILQRVGLTSRRLAWIAAAVVAFIFILNLSPRGVDLSNGGQTVYFDPAALWAVAIIVVARRL